MRTGTLTYFRQAIVAYVQRRGPLLAQGIAYSLLLGSVPFLLLSVALASFAYHFVPSVQASALVRIRDYLPDPVAQPIISQIDTLSKSWAGMGVVGVLMLVLVSKGIFDAVGSGLGAIMGGQRKRSPILGQLWSLLLTGLALILVWAMSLDNIAISLLVKTANLPRVVVSYRLLSLTFSTLLLSFMLFLAYTIYASARLSVVRTILASLAVSALWHALGKIGVLFVVLFARYRLVYGVFGAAVLYLVWLQVFAHLVLLGGLFAVAKRQTVLGEDLGELPTKPVTGDV